MKKQLRFIAIFLPLILLLTGCTEYNQPISSESEGFWNEFIVWPLVSVIKFFADLFGSYGLAIVVVTIIIRLAILPLTINQVKNSKKMQEIQPKMKELQRKYASKDRLTQQKYQQELQALMQNSGVNPFAGCLPIFIQMPILIGFYHAISRMNVTPEFDLGTFLVFPLAEPSITLAVLAGLIQYGTLMAGPAMDNPQMKVMMYIMPLFVISLGVVLPAALSLYWVITNIVSVVQNIIIYKPFNKLKKDKVEPAKTGGKKK